MKHNISGDCRYLDSPQGGNITIHHKAMGDYKLHELRKMMAYVPQSTYLFSGTIKENILYGRPDATDEEVLSAAKTANAHGFIMEQADGYDTMIGERGAGLSGGQQQRIAIAWAVLKQAPILLLDEATSALDAESERQVQTALDTIMKKQTNIVIAHRLSTIENVDLIYVIKDGQVLEMGNHVELLQNDGVYASYYHMSKAK